MLSLVKVELPHLFQHGLVQRRRGMILQKCLSSWHACEGVTKMRSNMHLLDSLMSRSNLFGVGLGVYWAIVLAVTFRIQLDKDLGDIEMMKRIGGQTWNWTCNTPSTCTGGPVNCDQTFPCTQLNEPCNDQTTWYSPQDCNTYQAGNSLCGPDTSDTCVICYKALLCTCQLSGTKLVCQLQGNTTYKCRNFNTGGYDCHYQLCPAGFNCQ